MVDTSGKASSLIAFGPPLDKSRGRLRRGWSAAIDAAAAGKMLGGRMRSAISTLAFAVVLLIAAGPVLAPAVQAGKNAFKKCAPCPSTQARHNKLPPPPFCALRPAFLVAAQP